MTRMGADEKMAGGSGFERAVAESHDYDEENDAVEGGEDQAARPSGGCLRMWVRGAASRAIGSWRLVRIPQMKVNGTSYECSG